MKFLLYCLSSGDFFWSTCSRAVFSCPYFLDLVEIHLLTYRSLRSPGLGWVDLSTLYTFQESFIHFFIFFDFPDPPI